MLLLLASLWWIGAAPALAGGGKQGCGATPLPADELVVFQDDMDLRDLDAAIDQSLRVLAKLPGNREYRLCGEAYTVAWLAESLREMRQIVRQAPDAQALQRELAARFTICRAGSPEKPGRILLTGYFEPLAEGSLTPHGAYRYPLYRRPADLAERDGANGKEWGRYDQGSFVPYWSRAEIEKEKRLAGQELVYLADPLAPFILQVQGSGRVRLPDGTVRRVQFAGKNGRPYRSIGKVLIEEGALSRVEVDMPRIVTYLSQLPAAERDRILHANESYVFFRWGDDGAAGPLGCFGVPLTAGRSLAVDQSCFPPGVVGWLRSRKPRVNAEGEVTGWEPFSRFVLNHDRGSAIVGSDRADLFWGAGPYARTAAGLARHPAELVFLVKKKGLSGPAKIR
ncbi:MAG: murein transglycosylase A [Thermodesulfobacteriota bacterium]